MPDIIIAPQNTATISQEVNNNIIHQTETRPLLLSVFSGSGGLDLGFRQAGYKIALAADNFPAAVATHESNHGPHGTVTKNLDLSVTTYEQLAEIWRNIS